VNEWSHKSSWWQYVYCRRAGGNDGRPFVSRRRMSGRVKAPNRWTVIVGKRESMVAIFWCLLSMSGHVKAPGGSMLIVVERVAMVAILWYPVVGRVVT